MDHPNQQSPKHGIQSNQTFTFLSAVCSEPEVVMQMLSDDGDTRSLEIQEPPPTDDPEPVKPAA